MANGIKRGPWALWPCSWPASQSVVSLSASHPIPIHWALGKGEGGKQSKARTAGGDWLRVGPAGAAGALGRPLPRPFASLWAAAASCQLNGCGEPRPQCSPSPNPVACGRAREMREGRRRCSSATPLGAYICTGQHRRWANSVFLLTSRQWAGCSQPPPSAVSSFYLFTSCQPKTSPPEEQSPFWRSKSARYSRKLRLAKTVLGKMKQSNGNGNTENKIIMGRRSRHWMHGNEWVEAGLLLF